MENLNLLLCLLFVSSVEGECLPTSYIVGGTSTNIHKFPFQVSIRRNDTNKHVCGGAVITEKFILTAAHCVCFLKNSITMYYIFLGSTTLSGNGEKYVIEDAICHAEYNTFEKLNDIGIIGVTENIKFNKCIKPVSILTSSIRPGKKLAVSGWGYTSFPDAHQPDSLQLIKVPVITLEECQEAYKDFVDVFLRSIHICTLVPDRLASTCKGDSGGPLTYHGVLAGIVSWGVPCAQGKPDANTKISRYVTWIKTTIDSYCSKQNCTTILYPKFLRLRKKRKGTRKRIKRRCRRRKKKYY